MISRLIYNHRFKISPKAIYYPSTPLPTLILGSALNKSHCKFTEREFHTSKYIENELIVGGLTLAGSAMILKYSLKAFEAYQQKVSTDPKEAKEEPKAGSDSKQTSKEEIPASDVKRKDHSTERSEKASAGNASPSQGSSFFSSWFARNFYDGGFEEKMTRREAALILGVRENSAIDRIKEAHRRILLLNHPDRGGSAFIAAKINEAKDLLLKGKQGQNA